MAGAGYRLYTSVGFKHRSSRLVVSFPVRCPGTLVRLRPRKMFFRRDDSSEHPRGSDIKVDAHISRVSSHQFETCDRRRYRTVLDSPLVGFRYRLGNGCEVPCLHLSYVAQLKKTRRALRHKIDLVAINDGVEAARRWISRHDKISAHAPQGPSEAWLRGSVRV